MSLTLEARYAVTTPLTTIFTPPASCSSHWTYEAAFYNSIPNGLLIQDALAEHPDSACFPSSWAGFGRAPSATQVFSPGACPAGYATAANSYNGAVTTAVCCPSSFSYMVTYSSINYFSTSAQFVGCVSTYPRAAGATTVLGRANGSDLNTTTVSGPLTMWAQPFSVAYRQADLALFTTTSASSSPTTSGSASVTSNPTASTASQTSGSSSSSASGSAASSGSGDAAASNTTSNASLSGGAIAGIAIGAAAVLGLIVGLAIFLVFRRRKEQRAQNDPAGAAGAGGEKDGGAGAPGQWNGSQQYSSVAQYDHYAAQQQHGAPVEMPTLGYGKSIRRAEKPADPVPQEMMATREPAELR